MNVISNFLKKVSQNKKDSEENFDPLTEAKNWYSDRYESVLVQRNIVFLFAIIAIFSILLGVFVIGKIATSRTIEPFIVEIEDATGLTNVVNPMSRRDLSSDEALKRYFIVKFIRARETYSSVELEFNRRIVRLLGDQTVNNEYVRYIRDNTDAPPTKYGTLNSTSLKIRSIQFLNENTAQVRFTVLEDSGAKLKFPKIATIEFSFTQMELNSEERDVNPLGFQITKYRVDDEIL